MTSQQLKRNFRTKLKLSECGRVNSLPGHALWFTGQGRAGHVVQTITFSHTRLVDIYGPPEPVRTAAPAAAPAATGNRNPCPASFTRTVARRSGCSFSLSTTPNQDTRPAHQDPQTLLSSGVPAKNVTATPRQGGGRGTDRLTSSLVRKQILVFYRLFGSFYLSSSSSSVGLIATEELIDQKRN